MLKINFNETENLKGRNLCVHVFEIGVLFLLRIINLFSVKISGVLLFSGSAIIIKFYSKVFIRVISQYPRLEKLTRCTKEAFLVVDCVQSQQ